MKIKLVFSDWQKEFKSVYATKEGLELSSGDFHSGSTFTGEIELGESQTDELLRAILEGYEPVFYLVPV